MKYTLGQTKYGPMAYLHNDYAFVKALSEGRIYEQELIEQVIAPFLKDATIILDIGAHAGSHSLIYSAINPGSKIYAFEPQTALRGCLEFNINTQKRPNIFVMPFALGNKSCQGQMHATIPDGPNCNLPISDDGFYNFGGRQLGIGGELVQICKLDDLWPAFMPAVNFIKIDVEGFEDFVVDGAAALIDRCRPVVFFEHNEKRPTAAMDGYYVQPAQTILEFFRGRGYSLTEYDGGNYLAVPGSAVKE